MRTLLSTAFFLGFLLTLPADAQVLALQGATVVDVTNGTLRPNQTVLVEGNRIAAIGAASTVTIPDGAEIVDATGTFLIPGLWDMHTHAANPSWVESFYPLFLAHGVTGIRETWGSSAVAATATLAIVAGEMVGPARTVVAGNLVDGPARFWPGSQVATTPEDGRRIVDSLHTVGAPFVKVYSSLTPETFHAIAERANELGIPFAGHVPAGVFAVDASDAGMRSMEHFFGVVEGCSAEEEIIMVELAQMLAEDPRSKGEIFAEQDRRLLATQDDDRCRALALRFIENETWQVPTLITNRGYAYLRELAAAGDARLRFLPASVRSNWFPEENRFVQDKSEEAWTVTQERDRREKEIIQMMAEAGVPFLAGSDTPNPWAFPGSGLHDELVLLVEAGLTPLQALQAATFNPARFFDRSDELGTVEVGKLADLVLLDANPLDGIANTQQIHAVIADGRLYRRKDLDEILADVERMNSAVSVAELVLETLEAEGIDAARIRHRELLDTPSNHVRIGEVELNELGYELLQEGRIDDAVAIFALNVDAYPDAANPYDSYADGFLAAGLISEARDALALAVEVGEASNDSNLAYFRNRLEQVTAQMAEKENEALAPLARQKVDLLILGATAIDPGTGSIAPNSLVALKNGLIEAVGNADDAVAFDATKTLDGSGQFIIPAFVDMHSHWGNGTFFEDETLVETTLARHLYYGVSRILNLGSNFASPAEIDGFRRKLAEGIWRGPEIYAVGALLTVPGSHPTTTIFSPEVQDQIAQRLATAPPTGPIDLNPIRAITLVRTPEDIRAEVRRLAAWGADAIKITVEEGPGGFGEHPRMSEQLIRASVEAAHREGIRVIAHISDLEELKLVLDAGVDAAAHSSDVGTDAIHRQMGEAGFFYITTLAMYEGLIDWFGHPERMDDPFLRESLRDEEAAVMQKLNVDDFEGEPFSATLDHVRAAHRAGALLLTGTDTGNPFSFPGYGIHQELRLFVEAGVEPLDALAAASVNAARFFGEEHLWGSLTPGQAADLIILDGDPLVDILNTQRIAHVIQAGAVVDRASLVGKMGSSQD